MNKPIEMIMDEYRAKSIQLINSSELPCWILAGIIKNEILPAVEREAELTKQANISAYLKSEKENKDGSTDTD